MQIADSPVAMTGPLADSLPIRQTVQPAPDADLPFATQCLLDRLSRPGRFHFVRFGAGGLIEAASDAALAEARAVLAQTYGELLAFGAPTVQAPSAI